MASALIRILLGAVLSAGGGCLIEGDVLLPFDSMVPRELDDGWTTITPPTAGFDQQALQRVFADAHEGPWQGRSLLVFRHGHLVAETYLKDEDDLTTRRAIWSCTKQVTGVLVGMAIEAGIVEGVEERLGDCIEEVGDHPDKADITLENLLQMQSGIAYSNDGAKGQTSALLRQLPEDSAAFILDLDMHAEPGTTSAYNDGDPHLLSICLQRRLGRPMDDWADEVLLTPLGLRNYQWLRFQDGTTFGGFGILTTPRELAKVGQLVMDHGTWDGEPLVSPEWIDEMTAPRVDSYDDRYRFGYQWWHYEEHDWSYMHGHGGQFVFLDWDTETMVVMTSEPNTLGRHVIGADEAAETVLRVLDAIVE